MKIFAYGSNMSLSKLISDIVEKKGGPAENIRKISNAYISGYSLVFNKLSKLDNSGKANITSTPGGHVLGVLYEIDEDDIKYLDSCEGGYARTNVTLFNETGDRVDDVFTYIAKKNTDDLKVYDWYWMYIVLGAQENSLDEDYIRSLKKISFCIDDKSRRYNKMKKIGKTLNDLENFITNNSNNCSH